MEAHLRQQLFTAERHGVVIQHAVVGDFGSEENVLQHGEMFHQRQFLVDDGDTFAFGIANVSCLDHFAGKNDFAFVAAVRVDPTQHFHQR